MITSRFACWLLLTLLLPIAPTFAQEYPMVNYTTRDGLPGNQVSGLYKDRLGHLWLGTQLGSCWFDGERFEPFRVKYKPGSSVVASFAEDSQGRLHIGSIAGMVRFDGSAVDTLAHEEFLNPLSLTIRRDDRVFMVTVYTNHLQYLVGKHWKAAPGIPDNWPIEQIYYDSEADQLLISARGKGVYAYKNDRLSEQPLFEKAELAKQLPSLSNPAQYVGKQIIAVDEPEETKLLLLKEGGRWQPFLRIKENDLQILRQIPFDYVCNHKLGTYLLERNSNRIVSLLATNFHTAIGDKQGYYIATDNGLYRVFTNGLYYFSQKQVPDIMNVIDDRRNVLWFLGKGAKNYQFDGQQIQAVSRPKNDNYVNIAPPTRDRLGNLWLPHEHRILRHDGKTYQFIPTTAEPQNVISFLTNDPQRHLIIKGGSLNLAFSHDTAPYRTVRTMVPQSAHGSPASTVCVIDGQGNYWIGGTGIICYNYDTQQRRVYPGKTPKMPGRGIMGLVFDRWGTLWAAEKEELGGLFRYDAATDRFVAVAPGYFQHALKALSLLTSDKLLIGDVHNLYVLDLKAYHERKQVQIKVLTHRNGFIGVEALERSFYRDSRGRTWVPSSTVLMVIDPARLNMTTEPLRTRFTQIDGVRMGFSQQAADSTYALPFGQNTVSVGFEAIGTDKPFQTQFSYRIPGLQDRWSDWQTDNHAMLTNLTPGLHTVEIKARSGSLTGQTPGVARLRLRASMPFWQAPSFYRLASLLGLLLSGMIGLLWVRQSRAVRQVAGQQKQLKQQETKVRFLQIQTIQAQMNPHFTFNVLSTLQYLIYNQNNEQAEAGLVKLSKLIRNFLEATLLSDEETKGSLFTHEIPLEKELELLRMYVDLEQLQFTIPFGSHFLIHPELTADVHRVPPLLIQPYIENAIKHGLKPLTRRGNLWVSFSQTGDTLRCTIEDDGIGRAEANRRARLQLLPYRSRGTELVERRVALLNEIGYQISVTTSDRAGGGTVVDIHITA
jgi:ligand-binding sensor domain-containing protein/anti-sigma regulatory factor (Ser/Thr protein kinase)